MARSLFSHEDAGRREAQRVLAEKHRASMSFNADGKGSDANARRDDVFVFGEELVSLSSTNEPNKLL
jgi:hypothetical protein